MSIFKQLRILWNKIKRSFTKKMEVEQIINKWFEDTFESIQEQVHPQTKLDILLAGVFFAARKYAKATIVLLNNKHITPTKALLRILCELYVKLLWCLSVSSSSNEEKHNQKIYENFRRWDFSRVCKEKKLLEKLIQSASGGFKKQIQKSLDKAESEINKCKIQSLKCMPDTACIFRLLSDKSTEKEWETLIYPKIYQNFSSFVHLDTKTFRQLVKYKENKIICYDDLNENDDDLLRYCVSMSCDINIMLRNHWGFDASTIQEECKEFL